ncbi:MAG: ATP-binding protein [Victivallales bacterium]
MFAEEIRRKIEDFREIGIPGFVRRETVLHSVGNMVSSIIGGRRCGKSFMAWQAASDYIASGFIKSPRQICHVDFDNPIFSQMGPADLKLIQEVFLSVTPELKLASPAVFIFDEIHNVTGWERYLVEISRNNNWKVIATGSSSRLLRGEMSKELRGKAISTVIYPLSFSEFLRFRRFDAGSSGSTKNRAEIRRYFSEYLQWGAYPALCDIPDFSKPVLLREYFDAMMLSDIIQRYNVSRPRQCVSLYRYLLSNMAKPYTQISAFRFLKQAYSSTSRNAVFNYVGYAEDAWLLFSVPIFSTSIKEQERNYKKAYCIDWALAMHNSPVWDGSMSRGLENMIYIHLLRKGWRINYHLTKSRRQELDFIVRDSRGNPHMAVQVCMNLSSTETIERELAPLRAASEYFGIKNNFIVTCDQEKMYSFGKIKIHAIPAWKWLIEF